MFKAEYEGMAQDDYRSIGSGVAFGVLGKPLHFRLTPDATGPGVPQQSLQIELVVARDPGKKALEFAIDMPSDSPRVRLAFYNPIESGSSGLTRPVPFVYTSFGEPAERAISIMFVVDFLTSSETYRVTYEFAEGKAPSKAEEPKQ